MKYQALADFLLEHEQSEHFLKQVISLITYMHIF